MTHDRSQYHDQQRTGCSAAGTPRVRTRLVSLRTALTTMPDLPTWRRCGVLLGIYGVLALALGRQTGFLRVQRAPASWRMYALVPGVALIFPCLSEEAVFRGLLVPHPREDTTPRETLLAAAASLALFIVYHPLNGVTFSPHARHLFSNPRFLTLAALLGFTCTRAYRISGSLWPPVLIHWLTVVVWMLFLGGRNTPLEQVLVPGGCLDYVAGESGTTPASSLRKR